MFVTFEAVPRVCFESKSNREATDSTIATLGEARPPLIARSELPFPNPSFHFEGFLTTTGETSETGVGGMERPADDGVLGELMLFGFVISLSSLAKVCDADARISDVASWTRGAGAPLPLLPRVRCLVVEVHREIEASSTCSSPSSLRTGGNSVPSTS